MANFFNEIAGGAEKMQAQFLGPTYNYAKNIASRLFFSSPTHLSYR